jgi:hypothetical protein
MSKPAITPEAKNLNERTAHMMICMNICDKVCGEDLELYLNTVVVTEIIP